MEVPNANRWERPDAPLGTLVFRAGLLSKEKLEAALEEGQRTGRRLGEILLQKGWIDEKDLARLLAGQKSLQFVSLRGRGYDLTTARLLPERVCRYHTAVAIENLGDRVVIAIADPTDDSALEEIRDELKYEVDLVVATGGEITAVLDEVFHPAAAVGTGAPVPSALSPIAESGLRIAPPLAQPAAEPEPDTEAEPEAAHDSEPTPVAEPEPEAVAPEVPVESPEPVSHEPAVAERAAEDASPTIERNEAGHVSVAFHAASVVEPEPEAAAEPEPEIAAEEEVEAPAEAAPDAFPRAGADEAKYRIVLCLDGGDEVDVAFFADEQEAAAAAREFIAGVAKDGEWPRVGNQFIRPERIVSVDIRERQRYSGSRGRADWGADDRPGADAA